MMDSVDMQILLALQDGIPLVREPFSAIAAQLEIEPYEVIERLQRLRQEKIIRKFGLFVRKRKVGVIANAMVIWAVPSNRVQEVAEFLSGFREVTHCYERRTAPNWRYNVYTVIHGVERKAVSEFVKRLATAARVKNYLILFSLREFVRRSTGRVRPEDLRSAEDGGVLDSTA
jgi:DNA-binding Lrp family transcriptional regulator